MIYLFCLFTFFASCLVAIPWLVTSNDNALPDLLSGNLEKKQVLLKTYASLEFDFQTQKISPEDFAQQKAILLAELQGIYALIDKNSLETSREN